MLQDGKLIDQVRLPKIPQARSGTNGNNQPPNEVLGSYAGVPQKDPKSGWVGTVNIAN